MKLFKKKKILATVVAGSLLLIIGAGCKKTLDINHDPNNPGLEVGTPKIVFPVAVMGVAAEEGGDLAMIGGLWGEYITQGATSNQYKNVDQFDMKTTDYQQAVHATIYIWLKKYSICN